MEGLERFYSTENQIEQEQLIPIPNSLGTLAVWTEFDGVAKTPHYAITRDGQTLASLNTTQYELLLRSGKFDPRENPPPADEGNVYLVQFWKALPEFLEQLRELGGNVYKSFPSNANIVGMPEGLAQQVSKLLSVRWVGSYKAEHRMPMSLFSSMLSNAPNLGPKRYNIAVLERGPTQQEALKEFIESLGGTVDKLMPESYFMEATLDGPQLSRVVRADQVMYIDEWVKSGEDMDFIRWMGGADYIERVAGLTGEGVVGEVADGGVRATHVDFAGSLMPHGDQGVASHGTSTTGIVFGKGLLNPRGRGMLPDGQGISALSNVVSRNRFRHTVELKRDFGGEFQSNSWGGAQTTAYTTTSMQMDDILFNTDFVILNSQSNTGDRRSRPEAWAKNIVSVGGIHHRHDPDMSTHCWRCPGIGGAASIGPASDGRIKPDLAHFNHQIFTTSCGASCASDSSYTQGFGGTSGATPVTAGHFGLFFQMWHQGLFGNQVDRDPHMTTTKAFMINTARQWPFNGEDDDRTRVHQGWGMADLVNLYNRRGNIFFVDESDVLQEGQMSSYNVTVSGSTPALKATLVYKDPMGHPEAGHHRVNDLSLHVLSPSKTEYWGNYGLLANMWSVPGGEEDHLNTVENVFVENPEPGVWMVEVVATEIVEDGHPETKELDADYALVVSGVIGGG